MEFNIELDRELNRLFDGIVNDIIYVFPQTSKSVAEKTALTCIQYPKMLLDLQTAVKEKRTSNEE